MCGLQFVEDVSLMVYLICLDMVIEMNNFYILIVYEKGVEVICMIYILFGEENFQKGMQFYFECYDGSVVICDDFVQVMEDVLNVDFFYFCCWYSQFGILIVIVKDDYNLEIEQYILIISQCTLVMLDQVEKQLLYILFVIELYDNEGKVILLQKGGYLVNFVLNVIQVEQIFVFDNVYFQLVFVLLCEFFVLVKLEYKWSDQ